MPRLTLEGLEKRYGEHAVVSSVSLAVADGEFVSLLGPSGCGKTTVLRMVAGLVSPSAGRIRVDEREVTHEPPHRRRIGLVFQSYALFPHLSVFENVAFGLRRAGVGGDELKRRVDEALASVRLAGLAGRMPRQLSGGQQQRVAVARSLAPRPSILLFDEPLSNLDAALRDDMQIELKRLQREVGITTLFVTHDQTEALAMSDRVCVLSEGRVQQFGTPEEVYHRPANAFVAGFLGRPNRLRGQVVGADGGWLRIAVGGGVELPAATTLPLPKGAAVDLILRQEELHLTRGASGASFEGRVAYPARVALRSFVGARVRYVLALAEGLEIVAELPGSAPEAQIAAGEAVQVHIDPGRVHLGPAAVP